MIEKILKDRLVSINLYEEKLKKDSKRLVRLKKSDDEVVGKRAGELDNSIGEVFVFIETYKKELNQFLANEIKTFEVYKEKLSHYDDKFFEVLRFIEKKEETFRQLEV